MRAAVQNHARLVFAHAVTGKCAVCDYAHGVDLCHKKAVSSFPDTATLAEINALDNLVELCPNHHWEHDHGILKLPRKAKPK